MEFDKPLTDKMKAHLTQDELDRIEHVRPQMTYTTTHFIKLLIQERIQKAALLAACKLLMEDWLRCQIDRIFTDDYKEKDAIELAKTVQSAVDQTEEVT